jgi:hypothetical protein
MLTSTEYEPPFTSHTNMCAHHGTLKSSFEENLVHYISHKHKENTVAPGVSNAHTEGDSECVIFY